MGQCFSDINFVEEYHNEWTDKVEATMIKIMSHPDEYEGVGNGSKLIHNDEVRNHIATVHKKYCWLRYVAAYIRFGNRQNMEAIGISEEKVMRFTDSRVSNAVNSDDAPKDNDFYTPQLEPDSTSGIWRRLSFH